MRKFLAVLLVLPTLAAAAPNIPPWTLIDGNFCYSAKDIEKLKAFDREHEALSKVCDTQAELSQKLRQEVAVLRVQRAQLTVSVETCTDATKQCSAELVRITEERDTALREAALADGRSITGGALPWFIAGVSAALVTGIVIGLNAH